jgi:hypothetical protein
MFSTKSVNTYKFKLCSILRMSSYEMWRRVGIVSIDVSEKFVVSTFQVEIISGLGTTVEATSRTFIQNIGSNKLQMPLRPRRSHSS